jgi:hypothetical protein
MLMLNVNFSATCAIWFKEKEKRGYASMQQTSTLQ